MPANSGQAPSTFNKAKVQDCIEALEDIMKRGMSKKKSLEYLGHFNELFLFLNAAKAAAPEETK